MAQSWIHANTAWLAVKDESVYGTDPTPTVDNMVLVRNFKVTPKATTVPIRRVRAWHPSAGAAAGMKFTDVEFEVPLPGVSYVDPASTAISEPDWAPLLKAAGFTSEVGKAASGATQNNWYTFQPTTYRSGAGQSSCTVYCVMFRDGANVDGTGSPSGMELREANGCVFNVEFFFSANEECYMKFTGRGLYNRPAAFTTDISTTVYDEIEDAVTCNGIARLLVGSNSEDVTELSINMNWTIKDRMSMSGTGGLRGFMITREPGAAITGSMNVEAVLDSVRSRFQEIEELTGAAFDLRVVSPGGVGVILEAPNLQLTELDDNLDGVAYYQQPFALRDSDGSTHDAQIGLRITTLEDGGTGTITDAAYDIF